MFVRPHSNQHFSDSFAYVYDYYPASDSLN